MTQKIFGISAILSFVLLLGGEAIPAQQHPLLQSAQTICEGLLKKQIHIVIEGAGDVVERFYAPALKKLKTQFGPGIEINITFTDTSQGEDSIRKEKRLRIKTLIENEVGANYIDKSTPEGTETYLALKPDYVVIATPAWIHSQLAQNWLLRKHPPQRIFIEKPVDSTEEPVQNLLEKLEAFDSRVMALDHYRPKSGLTLPLVRHIEKFLGGRIHQFRYYLLENRSSADPTLQTPNDRDGAIEGEGRVSVLREGVALDLLSHMLAVVDYFGTIATMRPVKVWAGRYLGVDGDPNKPTEIPAETFFAAQFVFLDRHGNVVNGEAAVGKGIRGVHRLGPEYDHNAKLIELTGTNGRLVRIDLRREGNNAAQLTFFDSDGTMIYSKPLEPNPYEAFFRSMITDNSVENGFPMHLEQGHDILIKLNEFRHPIKQQPFIPVYLGGMRNLREAPYVEDLLASLPQLSGPNARKVSLADRYPQIKADRDLLMIGGAGVMGKGFTRRLAEIAQLKVVVLDPNPNAQKIISELGENLDITLAQDPEEAVAALKKPRKLMLLVPNQMILDQVLTRIESILEPGDIVIDGGNSLWSETEKRQIRLATRGIEFIGMGVSGGERGAWNGSSMMPGGSPEAYNQIQEIYEAIAAHVPLNDGKTIPSIAYMGRGGAGHYVKMVHNGIEYAEMQMLAEVYDVLSKLTGFSAQKIQEILNDWNQTEVSSFLLSTAAKVLGKRDLRTGKPLVDLILDQAQQKGTGKWTAESSLHLGVYAPTLDAAVQARFASSLKTERIALEEALKGPAKHKLTPKQEKKLLEELPRALHMAQFLNFAQGLHLLQVASQEHFQGGIDLASVTRTWRSGSILQGKALDTVHEVYSRNPKIKHLLFEPSIQTRLNQHQRSLRYVVTLMLKKGIPLPAFSSALAYYDSMRRGHLPANLLQAMRDYFGGHQFERVDEPGVKHHDSWE